MAPRKGNTKKGSGIVWTKDTLTPGLKKFPPTLHTAIALYLRAQETKVQNHARTNAPWNDQTGNARNGLFAQYSGSPDRHEIRLYHTVPYGIWLEVRWSGKYAIIVPTIQTEGARIMSGIGKLIDKMGGASSLVGGTA